MIEFITYKLLHIFISNHNEKRIVDLLISNKNFKSSKKLIIFDVGCYIGDWTRNLISILNKKIKKKYIIYLFDANKKVKQNLHSLIKRKNIYFNNVALDIKKHNQVFNLNNFFQCSGSSIANIYMNDKKWVDSRYKFINFFSIKKPKKFSKVLVKTNTIDDFCKKKKITNIDLLKIDVEGSEENVIFGAKKNLRNIKIIYTEIVENKKNYTKKEKNIINYLKKHGFELVKKDNIGNVSFFSNIIAKDNIFINKRYF